jgi:hypothetical protein
MMSHNVLTRAAAAAALLWFAWFAQGLQRMEAQLPADNGPGAAASLFYSIANVNYRGIV